MRVLFVCTGNIFRSAMAQGFLQAVAARRGLELTVASAGTTPGIRPISPNALEVMGEDGLAMRDHLSRELVAEELHQVDLVLCMEREHVRRAVVLEPGAWAKTFTFKELVRRGESAGARFPGEPVETWLERVGRDRRREELFGSSESDDVADPVAAPMSVLRATAEEIRDLVARLVDLLYPRD
jgi:protein-tyrosine phosphatase